MAKQKLDILKRSVTLEGFTPIMFDRYAGDNKTQLPVEEKLYFIPGTRRLCIPSANVKSFLCAENTTSVAKLIGGKAYKALAGAMNSFVQIEPFFIPLERDGQPIEFGGFVDGEDAESGIIIHHAVARLPKGIPNPKERPMLNLPWELSFTISLYRNDTVDETLLRTAFQQGGIALGLGTYRGQFGKFFVRTWSDIE